SRSAYPARCLFEASDLEAILWEYEPGLFGYPGKAGLQERRPGLVPEEDTVSDCLVPLTFHKDSDRHSVSRCESDWSDDCLWSPERSQMEGLWLFQAVRPVDWSCRKGPGFLKMARGLGSRSQA